MLDAGSSGMTVELLSVIPAKTGHAVLFSKPPGATIAISSIFSSFLGIGFRRCDAF